MILIKINNSYYIAPSVAIRECTGMSLVKKTGITISACRFFKVVRIQNKFTSKIQTVGYGTFLRL